MIRSLIWAAFYLLMIPSIGIVFIPWTFITGSVERLYWSAMWAAYTGVRIIGVEVDVRGLEDFDKNGTYIYMCNHVSNLDPAIVVPMIPRRTSVMVKKELFAVPLLSKAMRLASFVPVDRRNREAAIASMEHATDVMKAGVNMTAFPEGTRSPDGKLLPFKKGPFHLAMESGVPVLPMTIFGTEKMMPKNTWKIGKGKATLIFHPPISPKDFSDKDELMKAVRDKIASGLPEEMR
ncbi:MAG: 1-acyl-sn-glycerol-3-phosphate acyltransferase [Candidatus Angelobacter sp.]|nr:1-acyl-sn-glycerol-3-phosphate acyltransferase [Candidatus Angelobacter sp.]